MILSAIPASLLVLAVRAVLPGQDGEFPADLGRWYVTAPPEELSDDWLAAQMDIEHEWVVTPGKTVPQVGIRGLQQENPPRLPFEIKPGPAKEGLAGRRVTTKVDDGWLVGFDAGEFGAGLWWFSPDGRDRYKISDDHVIEFFSVASSVIALTGMEHGGVSEGNVIRFSRNDEKRWVTDRLMDLGERPHAAIKNADGTLLVATHTRLIKVDLLAKSIHVIVKEAFWEGMYPNSIATSSSGTIFIGMRHGVARIDKTRGVYNLSWMLPSKEFADRFRYKEGFN